ncbi:MAG: cadherin-like domain-containing protein [Leptolyngbyaceae cyanobacterium SL_7_1]|nr:cadherin-like domain-containing protein [Leptolyngbyaceae cyanobacterium SL_7_1]
MGLSQFANLVPVVAGVIAANNAEIGAIANDGTLSLEDAKQAIIAVQLVAQGDVASDLFELGAGTTLVLAASDSFTAVEDTVLEISVNDLLSNDQSVEGAPLSVTNVSLISGSGTVTLDDRGTADTSDDVVIFTPELDFFNPDIATYETNLAFFNSNPDLLFRPVIEYTVSDGNGNTNTAEAFITVNSANDAPVLAPATVGNFVTYDEDPASVPGTPVATLLGTAVTDVDLNAVQGIAITGTTGTGTWQYSTNNGTSWVSVGTVANNSALLLAATTLVRFIPAANYNGTAALTYRAWDQSSGAIGNKVDTSLNGGTTGFSTTTATSIQAITAVNDAPVNALPGNQSVVQGATRVFSAATGNAITVSDVDAEGGIERVTVSVTQGQLALGSTTGLTAVTGNGSNAVTIQGTVANLNAALNGLTYTPTPQAILAGAAVLTVTTNDLGNSGGAALEDVDSLTIAVTPQNGIFGTNNGEQINGTRRNDTIFGLGGDDRIFGKGGNDIMDGGAGNDILTGDGGNDFLVGGDGNDIIYSKGGRDMLFGGNGDDTIYSGGGRDFIDGGVGNDTIYLSGGRNVAVMKLGEGIDTVIGYRNNTLQFDLEQLTFGQLTIAQTGRDVQIRNGSEILAILTNTQTRSVTASNFI